MAEPMTTEGTLERLRWLVTMLPPLPWTTDGDGRYGRRVVRDWNGEYTDVAEVDGYTRPEEQAVATADAIAAVFNALPALLDVAAAARQLERVAPGTPTDKPYQLEWLSPMGVNRYMAARAVLRAALAALDRKEASDTVEQ